MNKTNLLFLGTTNYGFELSKSDENKFRELNEKFNVYVFTYGTFENEIDFKDVKIKYLKKPRTLILGYLKFYFFSIFKLNKFIKIKKNTLLSTNSVINTNNCEISVCKSKVKNKVIIVCVIDNLIKGGAGQAVQNLNLLYNFKFNEGFK